jgi:hypothetical protein
VGCVWCPEDTDRNDWKFVNTLHSAHVHTDVCAQAPGVQPGVGILFALENVLPREGEPGTLSLIAGAENS